MYVPVEAGSLYAKQTWLEHDICFLPKMWVHLATENIVTLDWLKLKAREC